MSQKNLKEENLKDWITFAQDVTLLKKKDSCFHPNLRSPLVDHKPRDQHRWQEYYETKCSSFASENTHKEICKIKRTRKVAIEGRIDLHGYTREQAHQRLQSFLLNAQIQAKIWVLVITGKGRPEISLTLNSLVPKWLDNFPYVSSYALAKAADGGRGALYVRLKKLKDQGT